MIYDNRIKHNLTIMCMQLLILVGQNKYVVNSESKRYCQ